MPGREIGKLVTSKAPTRSRVRLYLKLALWSFFGAAAEMAVWCVGRRTETSFHQWERYLTGGESWRCCEVCSALERWDVVMERWVEWGSRAEQAD